VLVDLAHLGMILSLLLGLVHNDWRTIHLLHSLCVLGRPIDVPTHIILGGSGNCPARVGALVQLGGNYH